jgi:hypothetical protein
MVYFNAPPYWKYFATYDEFTATVRQSAGYFDQLSSLDLQARHARSNAEYYERYLNSFVPFTQEEKNKILAALPKLPAKLSNIKYKFVKLSAGVELNNPHTIGSLVMMVGGLINDGLVNDALKLLLTHEIIHIYQRYNLRETNKFLAALNFHYLGGASCKPINCASNPDVANTYTYMGKIPRLIYIAGTNIQPNYAGGMADVLQHAAPPKWQFSKWQFDNLPQSQPEEIMAELLSRYITGRQISEKYIKIISYWLNN